MSHPFSLVLKIADQEDSAIEGEFSDSEHGKLQDYLAQFDRLTASKPLREGFPCEVSLLWDEASGVRVETELPDSDTLSILLHQLRPFILEKEPASYRKVASIIGRRVQSAHVRDLLRRQREYYEGRSFQLLLQLSQNDEVIKWERALDDWLNSHEYHRDPEKREAIDDMLARMPGDLMRGVFILLLVNKVNAIRNLASLVALLLGKTATLDFAREVAALSWTASRGS